MIPAHIETVEAIPRLSNGKIDRVALQRIPRARVEEPAANASTLEDDGELSRLMGIIRAIWSDVLECDEVYEEDNFFELGGDSLTSINVVSRAAEQGVVLKPGDLFDFPKLLELCGHLVEEGRVNAVAVEEATGPTVRSKNVDGSRRPFFMVHGGGRLLSQLRDALGAEQPIHLLSAHWEDANLAHDIDLDELAAEALAVLLEIQPRGPYQLGGYSFGAVIAFEIARILSLRGEVVDLLFMLDPPENPGVFHTVPASCRDLQRQRADASVSSGRGDEWQGLGPVGTARHALGKLGNHCRHYASRLAVNARYAYALGCVSVGRPVPAELRKLYVFRRYLAAAGRYDLRSVDCPILLYRARRGYHKYGPALWLALAEGGITLVEFDCEHDDLQWNPATVEEWTRQFAVQFASPGALTALETSTDELTRHVMI
jgi:hypothetical protein